MNNWLIATTKYNDWWLIKEQKTSMQKAYVHWPVAAPTKPSAAPPAIAENW